MMLAIRRDGYQGLSSKGVVAEWGEGFAMKECLVSVFDLFDSIFVVVRAIT